MKARTQPTSIKAKVSGVRVKKAPTMRPRTISIARRKSY